MSCAKKIKKLFAMTMVTVMMLSGTGFSSEAASDEGTAHELYYITYNEKHEVVEEGIIPVNENARYSWSGSITLKNGWYTTFLQPGPKSFYATKGANLKFSYKLNRTATIEYDFYQDTPPEYMYPTIWKTGIRTSSGTTITHTASKTAYYFVGVTNASSDSIVISNVSFVF